MFFSLSANKKNKQGVLPTKGFGLQIISIRKKVGSEML